MIADLCNGYGCGDDSELYMSVDGRTVWEYSNSGSSRGGNKSGCAYGSSGDGDGHGYSNGNGWGDGYTGCGGSGGNKGCRLSDSLLQLYITRREYILAILGNYL